MTPDSHSARPPGRRLRRELRTLQAMIGIYCRDHHRRGGELCRECEGLLSYAQDRLSHCPFGPDKPTCLNCRIHCYRAAYREQAKVIMRYAGPRMLWQHPFLMLLHEIDGWRIAPKQNERRPAG